MELIVKGIERFARKIEVYFGLAIILIGTILYAVSAVVIVSGFSIARDAYAALQWDTEQLERCFDMLTSGF